LAKWVRQLRKRLKLSNERGKMKITARVGVEAYLVDGLTPGQVVKVYEKVGDKVSPTPAVFTEPGSVKPVDPETPVVEDSGAVE
jgi:hypothetical protein